MRSLKIEIPSAEELERAEREILTRLASFDTQRDKIRSIYSSEAEQRRQEGIMDHITKLLRKQNGLSSLKPRSTIKFRWLTVLQKLPHGQRNQLMWTRSQKNLLALRANCFAFLGTRLFPQTTCFVFLALCRFGTSLLNIWSS